MRERIASIAGVRMVMSGLCACAVEMPSSISGWKPPPRAMPPGGVVLAGAASRPITSSTNSRAASRASAAGKYTLMVTQAVSTSAVANMANQRIMDVS